MIFVSSVIAFIYFQNEQEYEEHGDDHIYIGDLAPAHPWFTPRVPSSCLGLPYNAYNAQSTVLLLGKTSAVIGNLPQNVLVFRKVPLINFSNDGSVVLNLLLLDERGSTLVKIEHNVFTLNPKLVARMRQPSLDKLFVYDHNNKEVLHVELLDSRHAYLTGVFWLPGLFPFTITDSEVRRGGFGFSGACAANASQAVWNFD